jgi:aminoglycoside phosphotransferase family enzyme/predicted kinase
VEQRKTVSLIPAEQREIADWLAQLAGRPALETPISAVFVGKNCVWKLKKAVRRGFLDFSSLAARERFIRRELALNQPAAPRLYRDVVAVRLLPDGGFALGGSAGETVDFVLLMAPVPPGDFLDRIAADGRMTGKLLDRMADAVAAYHRGLPESAPADPVGALREVIDGNAASATDVGLPDVPAWQAKALAALDAFAPTVRARAALGYVRRAHGDLHLGNLCLWQGKPVLFDALEFDEAMATIDLGYDLAFLLMDLERRLDRAAANRVMNRYVAITGDCGFLPILPLFLSLRAMVRAHVQASSGQKSAAAAYLQAAFSALEPSKTLLVAVGGLPGSGKSTLARALAPHLGPAPGALVLRSDEIRKRQHGVAPEQKLPPAAYSADVTVRVFAELFSLAANAAPHHAIIADATFMDPAHRAAIAQAAGTAAFLGVWLQVPLPVLQARVSARKDDASDADLAVLARAAAADPGAGSWLEVAAEDGKAAYQTVLRTLP